MEYQEYLPYINVTEGLGRMMNMKKLYAKVLKTYLATEVPKLDGLSKILADKDFETAQAVAHTFKGVAANLSINQCYELSKALEAAFKEKGNYAPALNALMASVKATEPFVNKLIVALEQ